MKKVYVLKRLGKPQCVSGLLGSTHLAYVGIEIISEAMHFATKEYAIQYLESLESLNFTNEVLEIREVWI